MISKYDNPKILWGIYLLINSGLLAFIVTFLKTLHLLLYLVPIILIATAILLFAVYCRNSYLARIRRQVDEEMKISLLSVAMMLLPLVFLVFMIVMLLFFSANVQVVLAYGFTIFFGWLTAIILVLLIACAVLYNINVFKLFFHKEVVS